MDESTSELPQQNPEQSLSVRERIIGAVKKVVRKEKDKLPTTKKDQANMLSRRRFLVATAGLLVIAGCGSGKEKDSSVPTPSGEKPAEGVTPVPTSIAELAQTPQPQKEKLPDDIVSAERLLEEYNTRVWNTPDVKLHIREKALEIEPIFETMKNDEFPSSFDIILLNGPTVHSTFLTPEERENFPDLVKQLNEYERPFEERYKQEFSNPKYRKEYKDRYDQEITTLEQKVKAGEIDRDTFIVESELTKERYRPFLEEPRPSDFQRTAAGGMYVRTNVYEGKGDDGFPKRVSKYYVVLPVKDEENKVFKSGKVTREIQIVGGSTPDPKKSYPNGHSIKIVAPGTDYPADRSVGVGFSLRHEFAHHRAGHPQADMIPIEGLKAAYDAYQQGDDSRYYFVFETPKGNLYTKDQTADKSTVKAA